MFFFFFLIDLVHKIKLLYTSNYRIEKNCIRELYPIDNNKFKIKKGRIPTIGYCSRLGSDLSDGCIEF